jgi:hypothetical protein
MYPQLHSQPNLNLKLFFSWYSHRALDRNSKKKCVRWKGHKYLFSWKVGFSAWKADFSARKVNFSAKKIPFQRPYFLRFRPLIPINLWQRSAISLNELRARFFMWSVQNQFEKLISYSVYIWQYNSEMNSGKSLSAIFKKKAAYRLFCIKFCSCFSPL